MHKNWINVGVDALIDPESSGGRGRLSVAQKCPWGASTPYKIDTIMHTICLMQQPLLVLEKSFTKICYSIF